jgi:uncharacterized protein (TIGR02118 family)
MPTKITVIYEHPRNPTDFEAGYPDQLALARQVPGTKAIEISKVWPRQDGTRPSAYRLLDMYFTDYDAASKAVTTEEASAFLASVFQLATGGVQIVFADIEQP